jgi:hydrogenase expression/formation protein HypC
VSADERHCVTCSDEAVPMRVVEVHDDAVAVCAGPDGVADVMTDLVAPVEPGETLLVHGGAALARVG